MHSKLKNEISRGGNSRAPTPLAAFQWDLVQSFC
ncbi:hypothetical protein AYI69_g7109, partial [Smittium culicis]